MFSLDTDTVNLALRGHTAIARRVEVTDQCASFAEASGGTRVAVSSRVDAIIGNLLQILPYTDEAEQLYQSWTAKQKCVGPNDCRIAASALLAGFTVITCNGKDFSTIPGLNWQDWSQP